MVIFTACTKVEEPYTSVLETKTNSEVQGDVPLGRFVEEDLQMPEGIKTFLSIQKLEDGALQVVSIGDTDAIQSHISKDDGSTWKKQDHIPDSTIPDGYEVLTAGINKQGSIFTSYAKIKHETAWGSEVEGAYLYNMITADGEVKDIELPLSVTGADEFGYGARSIGIAENGDALYAHESEAAPTTVYRVSADDLEVKQTYELKSGSCYLTESAILVEANEGLIQYDLKTGEEKGIIDIKQKLQEEQSNMYIMGDNEDMFYIANQSGIYRYVAGGNVVEQLIDGSLVSLCTSDLTAKEMINLGEQEFLIAFQDFYREIVLKRYRYDADAPTTPNKELTVYSLKDNQDVRKMILEFQKTNPDTYVIYQIGMEDESLATTGDAIKLLNTEIMAGNGPDVLILNGLPMDSYIEKGILKELNTILEPRLENGELFENIIRAYEQEGEISAVPMSFKVPVIYGSLQARSTIKSLDSLLEYLKSDEAASFSGESLQLSRRDLIRRLTAVYGNEFIKTDKIDEHKLESFLSISKEIYDEITNGLEADDSGAGVRKEGWAEYMRTGYDEYYQDSGIYASIYGILHEESLMNLGYMTSMLDVVDLNYGTLQNDSLDYQLIDSENNYFMPSIMVGLNAKGTNQEQGLAFIDFMISEEGQSTQKMNLGYGFPVNRKIFREDMEIPSEAVFEKMGTNLENYTWASPEAFERFENLVNSLDTPVTIDSILFDALDEQAELYFKGEKDLQDAASDFVQKMNLYLAE